jgi:hypothetical protein
MRPRSLRFFSVCAFSTANSTTGRLSSPAPVRRSERASWLSGDAAGCAGRPAGVARTKGRGVVVQLAQRAQRMLVVLKLHKREALAGLLARRVGLLRAAQHLDLFHHRPRLVRALLHLRATSAL